MAQLNESHGRVKAPPRTEDIKVLRDYVAQLADMHAKLAKDLDFIINGNLDVKNLRAKSITAEALSVEELSAISANLGTITAGIIRGIEIYGSYIATSEGGFPRTEMSTTGNYWKIWLNETTFIEAIDRGQNSGFPQIRFGRNGQIFLFGHGILSTPEGDFPGILSESQFALYANGGFRVFSEFLFNNWGQLINANTNTSLAQELTSMSDRIAVLENSVSTLTNALNNKADKETSTSSAGSHNHGIADGTTLLTPSGTVTWSSAGSHSHTQK